jgi:hypothetical protein
MRMGNLLRVEDQRPSVMAASRPRLGVAHPTVVPRAPTPRDDDEAPTDEASDEDAEERGT